MWLLVGLRHQSGDSKRRPTIATTSMVHALKFASSDWSVGVGLLSLLVAASRLLAADAGLTGLEDLLRDHPPDATAKTLMTYVCDDEQLKNVAQQLDSLQTITDNLHLKLDTYNLRLGHMKELLEALQAGISGAQRIDVRTFEDEAPKQLPPAATLPSSCAEAMARAGSAAESGVYQLHLPAAVQKPFYAYCLRDPAGGAAWTVVQRRQDGQTDFYRNWDEYKRGFGNLHAEFFLGLDKLHALTHAQLQELWIQMEDFENATRYAKYANFAIEDESFKYALNVLGKYTGDEGDSLRKHEGRKFTTKDADHDRWERNCAVEFTGAWWYNACHDSNLNGQYLRGSYGKDKYGKGITWKTWHGVQYSLKYVHMAIRPL